MEVIVNEALWSASRILVLDLLRMKTRLKLEWIKERKIIGIALM